MKQIVRAYVVDERNALKRIPRARYQRMLAGLEAVPGYASETVRFAETVFGLAPDGTLAYARAFFPLVRFDASGKRDRNAWREEEMLALRECECHPDSEWAELYRTQRWAQFRWQPTETILSRLREKVPPISQRAEPQPHTHGEAGCEQ